MNKLQKDIQNGWKICSACCQKKELNQFSLYYSATTNYSYYFTKCKECDKQKKKVIKLPIFIMKNQINYKKCSKCKEYKELNNFNKNKNSLFSQCKKCKNDADKQFRIKNKDVIRKRKQKYHIKNKSNPKYKINMAISNGIRKSLNKNKNGNHWENLIGYNLIDLMKHLKNNFKKGMNFQNFGNGKNKWHIHHKLPKELFQYKSVNDKQFKICWSLENLLPEWSDINLSISDKLPNGKKASHMTSSQKINFIESLGYKLD